MQIHEIEIRNFRCFENFQAKFDDKLTVIVGDNGVGKSSLLDAVSIAVGTILTGFDGVAGYGISKDDALNKSYDMGSVVDLQPQYPVSIMARGIVGDREVLWKRELHSAQGRTTIADAKSMTEVSVDFQQRIRNGEHVILPLISYYGTGRLWAQKREKKAAAQLMKFIRQTGYMDCLAAESNERLMRKWFEKMTIQAAQNGKAAPELMAVKYAIAKCFEGITQHKNIEIQFNLDTHEIDILYDDQGKGRQRYPMKDLSDGYKNTLSMIADIAYRMAVLNPWLLDNVLEQTPGIVLIDEIDLHLHPLWQQRIIGDLRDIFPKIQFIVSTHAPSVISSVKKGNILVLSEGQYGYNPSNEVFGKDSNSILTSVMAADERPLEIKQMFAEFYKAIDEGLLDEAANVLTRVKEKIGDSDPELTNASVTLELERI